MSTGVKDYQFTEIEAYWQNHWLDNKSFAAIDYSEKPKYYVLSMYPYPSGDGLHIGHAVNYTAPDILARYKRAQGFNVLQPVGWDAFGLPTEQSAIKQGIHPRKITERNVKTFRAQLQKMGFCIDWDREINTTDPGYFKWTQWIFLQLFKRGLAYVDEQPVWFCPALGTVLANEEVIDGKSERGNHPVERRKLRQWVLRITAYAEKLLEGHSLLNWPESSIKLQKNWIGRSEGAEVDFELPSIPGEKLRIYTTRPDTLFGATYMVMSPEHPLVDQLATEEQKDAIAEYRAAAANKSDLERTELAKDKTGVFTGAYAINPVNGNQIPIWIADYVLMSYGTGAIMAVPAHDERDHEFAVKFKLPIIQVVEDEAAAAKGEPTKLPFCGKGTMVHSESYTGKKTDEGKAAIIADLEAKQLGQGSVQYKLRDWLFSRQRYWGEPFPIHWVDLAAYEKAQAEASDEIKSFIPESPVTYSENGVTYYALPIPVQELPLELPEVDSYDPIGTGESPLAGVPEWLNVWINVQTGETVSQSETKPEGDAWVPAKRETNTMPQWAGSCWYYMRYIDPGNPDAVIDPKLDEYWGVPDFYIGGAEHVNLHLLYARFWHQVLFDAGVTKHPEPFPRLVHQGMILGEMEYTLFRDADGNPVSADAATDRDDLTRESLKEDQVEKLGDAWVWEKDPTIKVDARSHKMSKSRGNVVNPDDLIRQYGADATRLFLMFLGPIEDMKPWNTKGIEGVSRFLRRLWREVIGEDGALNTKLYAGAEQNAELEKLLHESIKKITDDIERLNFNTVVSQLMILLNQMQKVKSYSIDTAKAVVQMLAPLAPHVAEELWSRLDGEGEVLDAPWPKFDPKKLETDEIKVVVQVNGKVRGELFTSKDADKDAILAIAQDMERVQSFIEGKTIRKVIYVPGKILNIVAN